MTASFDQALNAARAAAGQQHYPESALYVVATPIGNLADISLRALHTLERADAIACEDTRHTQPLLRQYGILGKTLLAVHQHNELEAALLVIERLQRGQRIAYVSDAGTPALSDPGARLVAAVRAAGFRVVPLPGASSVTTVLSAAGVLGERGFVFAGFLPAKTAEREAAIAALQADPRAAVLLEAPHRIEALARALAVLQQRLVTLGRELTKQFEEIATLPAEALSSWIAANSAQRTRGEFALVVHEALAPAAGHAEATGNAAQTRVLALLLAELPLKTAVRLAADILNAPRNALYEAALKLKNQHPDPDPPSDPPTHAGENPHHEPER